MSRQTLKDYLQERIGGEGTEVTTEDILGGIEKRLGDYDDSPELASLIEIGRMATSFTKSMGTRTIENLKFNGVRTPLTSREFGDHVAAYYSEDDFKPEGDDFQFGDTLIFYLRRGLSRYSVTSTIFETTALIRVDDYTDYDENVRPMAYRHN
ncbi:MAG: hypothetical protein ABIJ92_00610 [Candidatus Aenigmatarchaeota archaeon]